MGFPVLRKLGESGDWGRGEVEFGPKRRNRFEFFAGLNAEREKECERDMRERES